MSHKIGFKLNAKNINPAKRTFDGQAQLSYVNAAGKDANVQGALKKVLTGERWTISTSVSTGIIIKCFNKERMFYELMKVV